MLRNGAMNPSADMHSHVSGNITLHNSKVTSSDRELLLRQEPATIWLTGLSGAGKSTIAFELERRLMASGHLAFVLDGDNIRHGLSRDLGFSPEDRSENIRRIAEVAKLFNDAGLIVISSFISPYRQDRALAREIIGVDRFSEVYVCADIQICEQRDPKGLYKKARAGGLADFTGITAPYEAPEDPALAIDTGHLAIEQSVSEVLELLSSYLR